MNTSCLQENLAKGLAVVGRAVTTTSPLPVLSHVLVKAVNGSTQQIHLATTDLELSIACQIAAKVEKEGVFTLPARLLADLVGSFPAERIELSRVNGSLHLACGRNEADVKGIDAQEFPALPVVEADHTLMVDPDLLRRMIVRVAFAASTDETRPVLTGVLVRVEGKMLIMAAVDGFRLSVCTAQLPSPVEEPVNVIVPARVLRELLRLLNKDDGTKERAEPVGIHITPTRRQILFHLAGQPNSVVTDIDLISQLIEGSYPDFRTVIPQSHQTRVVLAREAFLQACKTALIFARSEANFVRLTVDPAAGKMRIAASSAGAGETGIDLDASVEKDPADETQPAEIGLNARFLIEVLSAMDEGQVALETTQATSPCVLRPAGGEGSIADAYTHVIMPLSIRGS